MRRILPALILGAILGCGRTDPATPTAIATIDDVDAAEALWLSHHITDYTVDQAVGCYCPPPREWTTMVRDGKVVSSGLTVEDIFERIRRARDGADAYQATFDPQLGYPIQFSVDWRFGQADDEWSIRLTNFRR